MTCFFPRFPLYKMLLPGLGSVKEQEPGALPMTLRPGTYKHSVQGLREFHLDSSPSYFPP